MNKAFILLETLIIYLIFTLIISYYGQLIQENLIVIKNHSTINQCLELEKLVINKIVSDLKSYQEKDFKMPLNEATVEIKYQDTTAFVEISGSCQSKFQLEYDDFSEMVINFKYY